MEPKAVQEAVKAARLYYRDGSVCNLETAETTEVKNGRAVVIKKKVCTRCGGKGGWRGWPGYTCFKCGGSGHLGSEKVSIYTKEKLDRMNEVRDAKRAVKEAERQKVRQEKSKNSVEEMIEKVEGFSLALVKAKMIVGRPLSEKEEFLSDRFATLTDMVTGENIVWSEKKAKYMMALVEKISETRVNLEEREKRAEDRDQWMKEGRYEIEGKIVSKKEQWSGPSWGGKYVWKIVVEDDAGYRYWGSLPTLNRDVETEIGERIKFVGTVTRSKDDPLFGFFKRPAKGEIIEQN